MSVNKYINGKLLQMSGNADTRLTKDDINTILGYTPADSSVCEETFKKYVQLDGGDTTDNITTFTSNDTSESSSWTDVDVMNSGEKHSGLFSKISTMFKNIRYLYKLLGTTDISTIGDGTVRGAISSLNSNFVVTCSTGTSRSITTEAFLNYLVSEGKIPTHKYMERKIMCTWAYANNAILTDTPVKVCLAGCFLEMVGNYTGSLSNSANNFMMRLTCSPTVWTSYPDSKNKTYVFRAVGGSYSWTELSNIQEIDDNITMVALGYTKGQNVELFDFYSNIISGKYNVGDRIKFNYSNEHTANVVVGTSSISMNGVTMVIERIPTSSWDIFIASIFTRLGGVYVFTIRFEGSFTSNYVQYIGTLAANQ